MNKNLNEYFDSMHKDIDNKHVFNEDGLRSLIDKQDNISGKETGKEKSLIKSGAFKMGIISSVIIASVLSWQLFFNGSEPKGNEPVKDISPENAISENQVEEVGEALIEPADTTTEITKIPILYLSAEELKPFGIELTDSSISFIHEYTYLKEDDPKGIEKRKLLKDGYNIQEGEFYRVKILYQGYKNESRKIIQYDGWDKKNITKTFPVAESQYIRDTNGSCGTSVGFYRKLPQIDKRISDTESGIITKTIRYIQDKKTDKPEFMEIENYWDYYLGQMVPVHYRVDFNDGWAEGYLWFVPNKEFYAKLPRDKAEFVRQYCRERDYISYSEEVERQIKSHSSEPLYIKVQRETIDKAIILDDKQAKSLGIEFDGEYLLVQRHDLLDISNFEVKLKNKYLEKGYSSGINLIKDKIKHGLNYFEDNIILENDYTEADSALTLDYAVRSIHFDYVYYDEHYDMYMPVEEGWVLDGFNGSTTYNNFSPESLVPVSYEVEFIKNNDPKQTHKYTLKLWYLPTPAFLSRLSPENRERVIKELELIEAIDKDMIQPAEACAELEDESLLGICQLSSVNIDNVKVYPNPAKNIANIKFVLNSPCKVSIALFKLTGRLEKEIIIDKQYKKGKHFLNLDLSDCGQDIYLLVVTTDKGDEVVRKVMKE